MKTHLFHISGLHCQSCERLAEMELRDVAGVAAVRASLARQTLEVTGNFGDKTSDEVAGELNAVLSKEGYVLSVEKTAGQVKWGEFTIALPLSLVLGSMFLYTQHLGLGRMINSAEMGYGVAFLIGVVASLSSCMAIVGGLVLSMAAFYAQKGEKTRPQFLFHASRLISFFILGGVTGTIGSVFQFGAVGAMVLGVAVGGVMLLMGIGLLNVFPWAKRLQLMLPRAMGERIQTLQAPRPNVMPLVLGAATFFLPCGFTQSMQLYTLTTGHFMSGALTMLSFALGTLPVLAILSFSPLGTRGREKSGVFFKTAGLVVVLFGLYDILTSLIGYGLLPPIF